MTWRNGRELNTATVGGKTYSYEYDVNGLRTRKTNSDGGYTQYYIVDGLTVAEQRFTSTGAEKYTLRYLYDESNSPVGFGIQYPSETTWTNYYFAKNLQGDVIALYLWNGTSTGTLVATYKYDPWGKPIGIYNASGATISQTAANVAAYNPFRYRGYRYDADTGFYYLQSRYYDPAICRFINADIPETGTANFETIVQYNLFAYCFNDPINLADEAGTWPTWVKKAVAVVAVAAVVVAATAVTVATCGAGSVAGVAMISATATFAAKTTEVAVLQARKGKAEGKSSSQIAKDTIESIYNNGSKILGFTPFTKSAGIAVNHFLNANIESAFGGKQTLGATLKATGGKVVPYAFATLAWVNTAISAFSKDPVSRAKERGYTLK